MREGYRTSNVIFRCVIYISFPLLSDQKEVILSIIQETLIPLRSFNRVVGEYDALSPRNQTFSVEHAIS